MTCMWKITEQDTDATHNCFQVWLVIIIYCWLIAQSTAQSHLGAFHKFKFCKQVEYKLQYKTCTLHKRKTYKHNPKGSPFGIALVKNGK